MPGKKKSWSMFPDFDDEVDQLINPEGLSFVFYPNDDPTASIREYDTNIMGRFSCYNQTCQSTGWSSKKVPITIRLYPDQRYNARVYHQRCMHCRFLSRPTLDASYAERVAYWLKKWSGIKQDQPKVSKMSKGPHQGSLCEGCKHGRCKDGGLD